MAQNFKLIATVLALSTGLMATYGQTGTPAGGTSARKGAVCETALEQVSIHALIEDHNPGNTNFVAFANTDPAQQFPTHPETILRAMFLTGPTAGLTQAPCTNSTCFP